MVGEQWQSVGEKEKVVEERKSIESREVEEPLHN